MHGPRDRLPSDRLHREASGSAKLAGCAVIAAGLTLLAIVAGVALILL